MQKGKRFFCGFSSFIILLSLLFVASCRMDGSDIKPSSAEGTQTDGKTLVIRANVSTEKQQNASARSAVPSEFKDTFGKELVFAGALYSADASENDKAFTKAEYNDGKITLSLEGTDKERRNYTLEIRAYKSGTEKFSVAPLLSGVAAITIEANATEVSAPAIQLKPYADSEENGAVSLAILIPTEYTLSISDEENFSKDTSEDIGGGVYKIYRIRKCASKHISTYFPAQSR